MPRDESEIELFNEESESSDNPHVHRGIYWSNLTVRNFLGTRMVLFPVSGAAKTGELLCIVGDRCSGKTLLLEAVTNNVESNYRRYGYCHNLGGCAIFITEINRLFLEELTVKENIRLAERLSHKMTPDPMESDRIFGTDLNKRSRDLRLYQKHLLSLYIAYVLGKPVVIHDEPFEYVKEEERAAVLRMLCWLKSNNRVVVVATKVDEMSSDLVKEVTKFYFMLNRRIIHKGTVGDFTRILRGILPETNFGASTEIGVVAAALHRRPLKNETREQAVSRHRAIALHWIETEAEEEEETEPPFVGAKWRSGLVSQYSAFLCDFLQTVFLRKLNLLLYLVTLIVPELITVSLSFIWSNTQFYNAHEIEISTRERTLFFPEGAVTVSSDDLALITARLDSIKLSSSAYSLERHAELVTLTNFFSCYVSSRFLTLFVLRYLLLSQFHYVAYFFKNALLGRSRNCNFVSTEVALATILVSRIPNLVVEYATNVLLFSRLLFLRPYICTKYAIVHTLLFLMVNLFSIHLLRFSPTNFGLLFYKGILFLHYVAYFFKNALLGRSRNCNFVSTEVALATILVSRIPNLVVEYATNVLLFSRLLFLRPYICTKYAIVHTLLFLMVNLFSIHLLRFSPTNFGLLFYKGILFLLIFGAMKLSRNFACFLAQLLVCHVLSLVGREIISVLTLYVVSLFLITTGLFL
ncbi:hypothetical protein ECANGB1_2796 [Enterospora canceri]|uniref:ABC transporter domain-containing protein n=1 Tax=Enterospora canceri TaxID=1081671 RepID=A0A1Y1S6W3_9MICR|nr:hypothetical protein ECANGB1_2796 [Enterospora canceri]